MNLENTKIVNLKPKKSLHVPIPSVPEDPVVYNS